MKISFKGIDMEGTPQEVFMLIRLIDGPLQEKTHIESRTSVNEEVLETSQSEWTAISTQWAAKQPLHTQTFFQTPSNPYQVYPDHVADEEVTTFANLGT
ncbi:hypothetical protein PO903_07855 [Paenibacillus sp. PK4536]|jgi:hypothetical protein|uniref:Uncharacterized protein n=1 Tax=Paenibacillus nuruki TaxID=1886670 RepID=A0A1E3KXS6_9BACL|nr:MULTISPECIES: hypothetical protein [Paenibacillus]ODP26347.1 hypothetical protein PTI45_04187 [Paenibacillus nuruki]WIM40778.1 hypothetical protein PO903_07855 [Paenibacillus sp. PK4536]CAJ1316868.1 GYF-2 domain-containing protein [Paenibacillus nuruki]